MKHLKKAIKRKKTSRVSIRPAETMLGREYIHAVGRRKEAIARVRLYKNGTGIFLVNNLPFDQYFNTQETRDLVRSALLAVGQDGKMDIFSVVVGGGKRGQSESVRLGVSRALVAFDAAFRTNLKKSGFLRRDARIKERKKYGLKRARRAPQWAKR